MTDAPAASAWAGALSSAGLAGGALVLGLAVRDATPIAGLLCFAHLALAACFVAYGLARRRAPAI